MGTGTSILGTALVLLIADATGFLSGFGRAANEMGQFQTTAQKVTHLVGLGMMALGGTILAAGAYSAKAAADFETSMQNIAGNTNMTTAQLDYMKQSVLDLGKQSGASFDDLGQGFMHITNLGYNGADATKILTAAMKSAVATGANVADVANSLGQVMKDFGMNANQASDAINIIHTAAAQGNMTLEEMVTAFGQTAGEAANLGMKLPDVAAALSALTRHGVTADEAGVQLKNMLLKIAAPSATSAAAIQGLSKVTGVDLVHDFSTAGLASKGLSGVLDDVNKATKGNIAEQMQMATGVSLTKAQIKALTLAQGGQLSALKELDPNIRGLYGMFVLMNNGAKDYKDTLAAMGKAQKEDIVNRLYQQKLQTTNQQMAVLKQNIQYVAITFGTALLPVVNSMIKALIPLVDNLSNLVTKHKVLAPLVMGVAAAIFILGEAIAGIRKIVGFANGIIQGFKDLGAAIEYVRKLYLLQRIQGAAYNAWQAITATATKIWAGVQWLLNAAMDAMPIIAIIAGIILLVGAIIFLVTHWKQVTEFLNKIFGPLLKQVGKWFSELGTTIHNFVTDALRKIGDFVTGVWDTIVNGFNAVMNFIKNWWRVLLLGFMLLFLGPIGVVLGLLIILFVNHFTQIKTFVSKIITDIWDFVKTITSDAINAVKALLTLEIEGIVIIFTALKDFFTMIFTAIFNFFVMIWDKIFDVAEAAGSAIYHAIVQPVIQLVSDVISWLEGLANSVLHLMGNVGTAAGNGIGGTIHSVLDALNNLWKDILKWGDGAVSGMANIGKAAIGGLINGLKGAMGGVGKALGGLNNILKGMSPPKEGPLKDIDVGASNIGVAWAKGLIKGMTSGMSGVSGVLANMGGAMSNPMSAMGGFGGVYGNQMPVVANSKSTNIQSMQIHVHGVQDGNKFARDLQNGLISLQGT